MVDWIDELLTAMPPDPSPPDLVTCVQARLASARRRARWVQRGLRLGLGLASVLGLWLIVPQAEIMSTRPPSISLAGIETWLSVFIRSPSDVILSLPGVAFSWVSHLVSGVEVEFVVALIFLALPMLYGVITLLSNGASQEGATV